MRLLRQMLTALGQSFILRLQQAFAVAQRLAGGCSSGEVFMVLQRRQNFFLQITFSLCRLSY
jgi:hypothetical protein